MKIYGHPISIATRQIFTVFAEKNARAELVTVDVAKHEQTSAKHLRRHPFGHIPVLEDDGFWLYETSAILRYLNRKLSGISLIPASLQEAACLDQWLAIEQAYFQAAGKKLFARESAKLFGTEAPDDQILDEGRKELAHIFDVMDKRLDGREFLAGNEFSLADLCFFVNVRRFIEAEDETRAGCQRLIAEHGNIASWWNRLEGRPSWQIALSALGIGASG